MWLRTYLEDILYIHERNLMGVVYSIIQKPNNNLFCRAVICPLLTGRKQKVLLLSKKNYSNLSFMFIFNADCGRQHIDKSFFFKAVQAGFFSLFRFSLTKDKVSFYFVQI